MKVSDYFFLNFFKFFLWRFFSSFGHRFQWPGDASITKSLFFGLKLDSREESITDDPGDACESTSPSKIIQCLFSFQKKFQAIVFPEPGRVRPDSQFSASLNFDGTEKRYNELDLEYFFIGLASFGTDDILI
ncbi:hypothetical protein RIR_jg28001.t1 [Rhizophagus irregularis DAOM 181602=DAOM 197198]|nr:hypothetical protein RIR_jg28001.t1 [Rhizophagus irregularis DAOM 181602=DAOM 197198]